MCAPSPPVPACRAARPPHSDPGRHTGSPSCAVSAASPGSHIRCAGRPGHGTLTITDSEQETSSGHSSPLCRPSSPCLVLCPRPPLARPSLKIHPSCYSFSHSLVPGPLTNPLVHPLIHSFNKIYSISMSQGLRQGYKNKTWFFPLRSSCSSMTPGPFSHSTMSFLLARTP